MRLFVALDLPGDVRAPLAQWTRAAFDHPDLRPVRPEALHVTLVFLGWQYERDVERIARAAFGAELPPVQLAAQEVVGVPRGRRPRLFALELADRGDELTRWQAGLSDRLEAERLYEPEKRPFWPHVTLARAKRGRTPAGRRGPRASRRTAAPLPRLRGDALPLDAEAAGRGLRRARSARPTRPVGSVDVDSATPDERTAGRCDGGLW